MIADLKPYPAYKDSGVPWLGQVPEHWEVKRLGQIGRLSKGNGGNKDDEVPTGMPCVRYGDLYTTHTYFILKSRSFVSPAKAENYTPIAFGDVLFAASGETIDEIGKSAVNLMRSEACCGGDVILFRPKRELEARYMGYATDCRPAAAQKAMMGRGITVKHIYGDQLKYLTLSLPPFPEQTEIVRFLDHADRRIRRYVNAKRKLIALLNEQKQAIIHRAVTRGLDPNVRLKPSGVEWLGDVPEHWETVRLKTLVTESVAGPYGSSLTKAMYTPAGYRVYGQQQVIPDDFSIGDYYISEKKYEEMSRYRVFPGDVLVSVMGTIGRVAVVPESVEPGIINPRLVRYRPDLEKVRPRYLQMAMLSTTTQAQIVERAKGTTMEGLNMQILGCLLLAVPPLVEQDAILAAVGAGAKPLDEATRAAIQGIALLREYRTRLIANVVTGKLDVREAAANLPQEADEQEPTEEIEELAVSDEIIDEAEAEPEAA